MPGDQMTMLKTYINEKGQRVAVWSDRAGSRYKGHYERRPGVWIAMKELPWRTSFMAAGGDLADLAKERNWEVAADAHR